MRWGLVAAALVCALWLARSAAPTFPGAAAAPPPAETLADRLDQQVPGWLAQSAVPGAAIAAVQHGELAWSRAYGWADAPGGTPITADTVFQAASVSKSVAAWGVMRLVQDGRLALDAPAERYLTRWHLPPSPYDSSGVTVRRLLSHMAGLSVPGYPGVAPGQPLPTLEESLSGTSGEVGPLEIALPPGAAWRYSGGGYTLLQLLVEEVTGRSFADYLQDAVLTPLGMTHSSFAWAPAVEARLAQGHIAAGEPLPNYRYVAEAAAGLYTTAPDLARWVAASLVGPRGEPPGRGVLTPASVAELFTPQPGTNPSYGLGVFTPAAPKGPRFVWHPGFNRGWRAYFAAVPVRGEGIVVLTNGETGWELIEAVARVWGDAAGVGPGPTELPPEEPVTAGSS